MDIIFRSGGQKIVIEVKTGRNSRIHTPFNFRLTPNVPHRYSSNEDIDGQAWYPDTFEMIDENSELRF